MSLIYFLFVYPQNKLEFDIMLQENKISSLDILMIEKYGEVNGKSITYECYTVLEAENKKLPLIKKNDKHLIIPKTYHGELRKLKIQERVFDEMVHLANYYRRRGINATIAGREIEEAIKESEEYHRDELRRLYTPHN